MKVKKKVCIKWRMIVLAAISFHFFGFSQEISFLENEIKGFWVQHSFDTDLYKDWKAQWIWMPESELSDLMLARKTFELTEVPKRSEFKITASSKYQLFVNGTYVLQGPARSAAHHQSFDVLDISSLLKKGTNVIAVKVHFQKGTKSHELEGRAGLLVQLKIPGNDLVSTDASWKVKGDASWDNASPQLNRFQLVVADNVDLSKRISNFQAIDFNDNSWNSAKPLLRNSGWPAQKKGEKATALTTPWINLVPRDIPYLKEKNVIVKNSIQAYDVSAEQFNTYQFPLVETEGSTYFKRHITGTITIPPAQEDKVHFILYDFGRVINGMPKLRIEGPKGTQVHVLSAPFIVDETFTQQIVASDYHDKLKLSGNMDSWQAMYFKATRYMAVAISGNTSEVKLHAAGIHEIAYPFEQQGTISTPEIPWAEDFWNASKKTIEVCTTDAFTDNYRERRQYAQTGYYAAMGNYFIFGDYELQKRYLIQVAQEQMASGIMPAYAPLTGDDYMVILDSNCLWLRSLYNYYLYSGDTATVDYLMPYADRLMRLLNSFTNDKGLLESPPYAYWLDHTLNDRRGANLCLNGHFLGALEDYSQLKKWLGDDTVAQNYSEKSIQVRNALKAFWDEEKGFFADALVEGERSKQFSEHANAMALASGVATPEQAENVAEKLLKKDKFNYIKREDGTTMVSPAMSYFLHEGLAKYGYEKESLELFNARFSKMLDENTNQTLWEEWWRDGTGRTGKFQKRTRSDAQTESVFPPMLFVNHVLGVKVSEPGMKELIVSKPGFELNNSTGDVPTPNGVLEIDWNISKGQLILEIPNGTKVKLELDSFPSKKLSVNGNIVNSEEPFLELNKGEFVIKFN